MMQTRMFQLSSEIAFNEATMKNLERETFMTDDVIDEAANVIYSSVRKNYPVLPEELPEDLHRRNEAYEVKIFHRSHHVFELVIKKFIGYYSLDLEVELLSTGNKNLLGIKTSRTNYSDVVEQKVGASAGVSFSSAPFLPTTKTICNRFTFEVPECLDALFTMFDVKDVRPLNNSVLEIDDKASLDELYSLISSPKRLFPVVVVTGTDISSNLEWCDERIFAEFLCGEVNRFAHVAYIPAMYTRKWAQLCKRNWDVYGGAVRTYYKDVNFDRDDDLYRHPLFTARKINNCQYDELHGSKAFTKFMIEKLKNNNCRIRIDWKERGHKFYSAAKYTEN